MIRSCLHVLVLSLLATVGCAEPIVRSSVTDDPAFVSVPEEGIRSEARLSEVTKVIHVATGLEYEIEGFVQALSEADAPVLGKRRPAAPSRPSGRRKLEIPYTGCAAAGRGEAARRAAMP